MCHNIDNSFWELYEKSGTVKVLIHLKLLINHLVKHSMMMLASTSSRFATDYSVNSVYSAKTLQLYFYIT